MSKNEQVIIGVDPGSQVTGFGIIASKEQGMRCLASGVVSVPSAKSSVKAINLANKTDLPERLAIIHDGLSALVERYQPQVMAVESVFHAKNSQSALKLGHARGIALLVAAQHRLPCYEYAPRSIKKGLTGTGAASKEQVQKMVRMILAGSTIRSLDASDALAVAIFHHHSNPIGRRLPTLSTTSVQRLAQ